MLTYNQKEHERWKIKAETDMACILVLADFEWKKGLFMGGNMDRNIEISRDDFTDGEYKKRFYG
jgi:hypothetical protein